MTYLHNRTTVPAIRLEEPINYVAVVNTVQITSPNIAMIFNEPTSCLLPKIVCNCKSRINGKTAGFFETELSDTRTVYFPLN